LGKSKTTAATGALLFDSNMHKIVCRLGISLPKPHWGSLQRSPDHLTVFRGPASKGRGVKGRGEEGEKRKRREEEGRRGKGRGGERKRGDGRKKIEKLAPIGPGR